MDDGKNLVNEIGWEEGRRPEEGACRTKVLWNIWGDDVSFGINSLQIVKRCIR